MKIMLITVTAGEGHNSTCKAIYNKLIQDPANEVKIIDLFRDFGTRAKFGFIDTGYNLVCRHAVKAYNMVYKVLQNIDPERRSKSPSQGTVRRETPRLLKEVYSFQPDVIISTHVYPAIALTNIRKVYPLRARTIAVMTDYSVHPFWEAGRDIDYLVTPTEQFDGVLLQKGYSRSQLLSYGLPVRQPFNNVIPKQDARAKLELDADKFTVLVMNGGGGMSGTLPHIKNLLNTPHPLQILVVNGKSVRDKERVQRLMDAGTGIHTIKNYGFVDFIDVLMSAADCMLSKCGCISANEALNKELPMLIRPKLVQQEYDNRLYLTATRAAVALDDVNTADKAVTRLIENPQELEAMRAGIRQIKKPNALNDICALIESSPLVSYADIPDIAEVAYRRINKLIKKQASV